jgi:CubicO group peptidase (beta-lactamase class C family)
MKLQVTALAVAIAIPLFLAAQDKRNAVLDKYFSELYKLKQFNGNVLVAEKGTIVYARSFGYADISAKKPNDRRTGFPIASVTKTITSTAILQLQEKGMLNINDRFVQYFPAFPYPEVTLKELLSHTSRIPSSSFYQYLDSVRKIKDTFFTNQDVIPALIDMRKPLLQPGKGSQGDFAYSNLNYYLLALLIEKRSGMPYGSYLRKNIFIPAGMDDTGFMEFNTGMEKNMCTEQRYRFLYSSNPERPDTTAEHAYIYRTYNFKGHGDIVATANDLFKYHAALTRGVLLKPSSQELAFSTIVPPMKNTSGYGLGWALGADSTNGKLVLHHGGGLGIDLMLIRNIVKDQLVIVLDNTKNPSFDISMDAMKILNGGHSIARIDFAKRYGRVMMDQGIEAAKMVLRDMEKDRARYWLSEDYINLLAYQFMWNDIDDKAGEVFRTNLALFPNGWNCYDSYGEWLLKTGKEKEAGKMYERSIELNPNNEGGKKALETIRKRTSR